MPDSTASAIRRDQTALEQGSNPRVLWLRHLMVNSYLVGEPGTGAWAVVDAGLGPFSARKIIKAAARRFGHGVKPSAIVLTHGHFDHVGGLEQLANHWNVPIYAHELELPYLTGRSAYPPPDPSVGGGLMARMAWVYPYKPINLGDRVHALPGDGVIPGMPGWRWIHTPGHSPGHVSLFRFSDRLLLAGDAFVTVNQESLLSVLSQKQEVHRPPAYFTQDWGQAQQSLRALLALQPEVAATGHGIPMGGERLRHELAQLVRTFAHDSVPAHGRYVHSPAVADRLGVLFAPPAAANEWSRRVGFGVAVAAATGIGAMFLCHRFSDQARRPAANS